jgi:hypothetical protein
MRINRMDLTRIPGDAPPAIRLLQSGQMTVGQLRAARPLPENAQKLIDDTVIRVGLDRLTLVADLLAEGLVMDLGQDFWGITDLQWDDVAEHGSAKRTMEPMARGENSLPDRTPRHVPIYLTWDDFQLGIRTIAAGQRSGAPLDVSGIEQKTRRVNEGIEDAAINGSGIIAGGNQALGIMNAPNVNAYTYESNMAWDNASKTGEDILTDVLAMIDLARAARRFGPYNLYVNTSYGNTLNRNFVANYPVTIRQRLEQIVAGGRNLQIREADQMATNRTALVQMTSDVIDVVRGMEPTVISWDHASGWSTNWVVMACMVTRVKTDYAGKSGIVTGNI